MYSMAIGEDFWNVKTLQLMMFFSFHFLFYNAFASRIFFLFSSDKPLFFKYFYCLW